MGAACRRCNCCRRRLESKPRSDLIRVRVRGRGRVIGLGFHRVRIGSGFAFGFGFYMPRSDLSRCLAHALSAGYLRRVEVG